MKHKVVTLFSASGSPPDFIGQRERVTCPCCGREIVIAVRPEFTDWEKVADYYKRYAQELIRRIQGDQ